MKGLVTLLRRVFWRQVEKQERELTLADVTTMLEEQAGSTFVSMRYDSYVLRERVPPYVLSAPVQHVEETLAQARWRLLRRMNEDLRPRVIARKVGP